jgi:hypothetical protein
VITFVFCLYCETNKQESYEQTTDFRHVDPPNP